MKKILSILLAGVFALSSTISVVAKENVLVKKHFPNAQTELSKTHNPKDAVTLIVEVEGDPVLAGKEALQNGVSFTESKAGKAEEDKLLSFQAEVVSDLKQELSEFRKPDFTYTALFNGFSLKATYGDIETIKGIAGVKNVYISEDYEAKLHLTNTTSLTHSIPSEIYGASGKGQMVAVLDSEFDVAHEFFEAEPIDPKIKSKEDMQALLAEKELNVSVSASQVYKNKKIPFAYDYYNKNADVYSTSTIHGTHVAGIIGGKNGTPNNNISISGVAPDVQLVLMKISSNEGRVNTAAVFAALDDAVKLGVCAVNVSIGIDYASSDVLPAWQQCFSNAYNAGVFISASAGNASKGFYKNTPLTQNIDYGAIGVPAGVTETTSVASAEVIQSTEKSSVAVYNTSSFGVSESLELKPEITAPGARILSSIPDDKYAYMSGTSMAAPHITGIVALMNEYLDNETASVYGKERVDLIENRLMSTAEILNQTAEKGKLPVPFSPRVQGAGLVNTKAAMDTPVILIGDGTKTKISLKDKLSDTITLSFCAKNVTNESVTYDNLTVDVLTDEGIKNQADGKYYVGESRRLSVLSHTLPETLTIGANETKTVTFTVTLDTAELTENADVFENGFFIDGFVRFSQKSGQIPSVGIPFTGFYGDWTKATVFDSTIYDEDGSSLYLEDGTVTGTFLYSSVGEDSYKILGFNGVDGYDKTYIGISPNGDGLGDDLNMQLTPMRTIKSYTKSVVDKNGNQMLNPVRVDKTACKFQSTNIPIGNFPTLPDGDYTLILNGEYNYETESQMAHTLSLPFYIDRVEPEIKNVTRKENDLEITVCDDRYLEYVYVYYIDELGEEQLLLEYIEKPEQGGDVTLTFSLDEIGAEAAAPEDIYIAVFDIATNYYGNSLSCLLGDIHASITDYTCLDNMTSVSLELLNYTDTTNCTMILAFYNEEGELICIDADENVTLPSGKSTYTFSMFQNVKQAVTVKLFVWRDLASVMPLDTAKVFNVSDIVVQ